MSQISNGIVVSASLGDVKGMLSVTFLVGTLRDLASVESLISFLVGTLRESVSVVTVACRIFINKCSALV